MVRYILAFAVFIAHFSELFEIDIYFPISSYNAVGGFFALSGFLVYPGYLKTKNARQYIGKRARRILPPYLFIVLLCAFGLVAVSTLNWQQYFLSPGWWEYLLANLTFLNFLEPNLPGVFEASPLHAINGSLWTMKVEWLLYLSVPIVAWSVVYARKRWPKVNPLWIFVIIYLLSMGYRLTCAMLFESTGKEIYRILERQIFGQLMFFYSGVAIWHLYGLFRKYMWAIVAIALIMSAIFGDYYYYDYTLCPVVVSVITLGVSLIPGAMRVMNFNNISYGIYLFHMPVLQLIYQYMPSEPVLAKFLFGIACVTGLALFSWFCIEKRFLPRKFV